MERDKSQDSQKFIFQNDQYFSHLNWWSQLLRWGMNGQSRGQRVWWASR